MNSLNNEIWIAINMNMTKKEMIKDLKRIREEYVYRRREYTLEEFNKICREYGID